MLTVLKNYGNDIASVWVARTKSGKPVEFVESFDPRLPIEKKWVLVVSVMGGCPVRCLMCDAGGNFRGNLSQEEILGQVEFMVRRRFNSNRINTEKWKIQFTRMGEPSFNDAVLDVIEILPKKYDAPGLIPSVSTIAPGGRDAFFERLLRIKTESYQGGKFQMQFSIHTSDEKKRDALIPVKKWGFEQVAEYGKRFFRPGDRKITLNFASMHGYPIDARVLADVFDPAVFLVKITPLNPTYKAIENGLQSGLVDTVQPLNETVAGLRSYGFDTIVSIGALEENAIKSNCGQYVEALKKEKKKGEKLLV